MGKNNYLFIYSVSLELNGHDQNDKSISRLNNGQRCFVGNQQYTND